MDAILTTILTVFPSLDYSSEPLRHLISRAKVKKTEKKTERETLEMLRLMRVSRYSGPALMGKNMFSTVTAAGPKLWKSAEEAVADIPNGATVLSGKDSARKQRGKNTEKRTFF